MSFYKPSKSAGARCLPACVYTHILLRIDEMPAIQQCAAASCCCYIKDRVAGSNQFETKSLLPVYCNRCRAGRVVAGLVKHPQVSLSLSSSTPFSNTYIQGSSTSRAHRTVSIVYKKPERRVGREKSVTCVLCLM